MRVFTVIVSCRELTVVPWIKCDVPRVIVLCRDYELNMLCRDLNVICSELIVLCRELTVLCRELTVLYRELIVLCRELLCCAVIMS